MRGIFLCVVLASLLFLGSVGQALDLDGMVLYLPFDEGAGNTAKDLSGKGNNGTIFGAKWTNDGMVGSALSFTPGNYVEVAHSDSLSLTDAITIMAWTYMNAGASGEMAIVSKGQWAVNDLPYELTETPGGVIFWQFYNDAGRDTCSPNSPPVKEWHHIAATYDGTIFKCYIDGVLGEEWAYAGKMPENDASVAIGRRSISQDCLFNGLIDEVAIFNRALTEAEVQEAMGGLKAAPVEPGGKLSLTWGAVKQAR